MKRSAGFALVFLCTASPIQAAAAGVCHAESRPQTTALFELYTSEGCDSCPPADRWLAANFAAPSADAVALAFHVDYWDRLGWKDRFASPEFTARQYAAMKSNGAEFVYTPQILLQGHDLPRTRAADPSQAARGIAATPARARIVLDVSVSGASLDVHASARLGDSSARSPALFLAYADGGLSSQVTAGENRGVRLSHEHVVRVLTPPYGFPAGGTLVKQASLEPPRERGTHPEVVAFVQDRETGDVLQALAVPLRDCANP